MKKIVLLLILAGLALWYFDLSRRMTEASIHEAYREQLKATQASNAEAICSRMTDDYRLVDTSYGPEGTRTDTMDREEACTELEKSLKVFERLGKVTGGLLSPEIDIDIKRIELSHDRKTATVEAVSTIKIGDTMLARSRGTEKLIRRAGRILSQGGESKTWTYAQ